MSEKESIIDLICQKFSKEKDDINEQLPYKQKFIF